MTLPKENLDTKTYEDLVKEAVSRIPVYAPEWTDHNIHDPGRTFIELFAWLAEMQIYSLNRITDGSRRKFLKLMGITELRPAKAANVDVTFSLLNRYLFSWDEIPGNDNGKLIVFLKHKYGIDRVKTAEIEKIDNGNTIVVSTEMNHLSLNLNQEKTEVIFKIDDVRTNKFIAKMENGKLNIYLNGTPTPVDKGTIVVASDTVSGEDISFETQQNLMVVDAELTKILVHPTWFNWDNIPGNDDERLIGFLKTRFGIEWAETAKIEKIDNDRTIKLFFEKNYLCLILNDEKTKVNLEIDDLRTDEFIARTENGKLNIYQNYIDRSDANKNENVHYYAFRSKPEVGDELCLGFDKDPGKDITLTLYLFEDGLAERKEKPKLFPSGKVKWEYCRCGEGGWNSVEEIHDETNHLSKSGKLRINVKETPMGKAVIEDNNPFWLRCIVKDQNYDIPLKIDQICLNTVCAVQRSKLKEYTSSGSGLPGFSADIKDVPVLDAMKEEVEGTSLITVGTDGWSKVEDFDASKPGDKHYTMDLKSGRVTFGDGIHGKIPPKGENNILVYYRTGGGVRGNVKAGAINRVDDDLAVEISVTNHLPASGGEDAETLEEAIQRARIDLKTPYRAVTSQDYERLARNTPGVSVARARALPGYYPGKDSTVPGIVSVIAVPQVEDDTVNPEPSQGFMKTVYEHLDKHRLLTTELFILRPGYEEITVTATVWIHPRFVGGNIEEDVIKKLNDFLHLTKGGPDGTGWPFGRSVYRSEIYEVIDRVEGVDHIEGVSLAKNGTGSSDDIDITIPPHSLVYSGNHQIEVKEIKEAMDA